MLTSNFKTYRNNRNGVSIAIRSPNWFKGCSYTPLMPKKFILYEYLKDRNKQSFTEKYYKYVLNSLEPWQVYSDLKDSVLLCWEKPEEFCHRRLVVDWLNEKIGVVVPELSFDKPKQLSLL